MLDNSLTFGLYESKAMNTDMSGGEHQGLLDIDWPSALCHRYGHIYVVGRRLDVSGTAWAWSWEVAS